MEGLESRVVLYSASGNAWPAPQLITISFMPDGTNFAGKSSNLIASMNRMFPTTNWQSIILKAAQTWAAQTNINFALVSDDGEPDGSGPDQQGYANYGDIRIGGYNFGTSTLAQAFMPPPVNNYSVAGDIAFNTGQVFRNGTTYDLYTVAVHEIGHALGLYHSGIASAEMYSSYNGVKNALSSDDIAGIQSIYGGPRKSGTLDANGSNSTQSTADDLTSHVNTGTLTGVVTGLDITTTSDVDWFKVTAPAGTNGTLKVSAVSQGLSLLAPSLTVENASGTVVSSQTGASGSVVWASIGQVVAGQTYYIKMDGADSSVFGTGAYGLTLNFGNNADPTVPRPDTTKPNGSPLSSGGGQALAVNYEAMVNTTTAGSQTTTPDRNAVAMDAFGNYVVVWASQNQDGSGWGVYAQRYNAAGSKIGGEFRVNTTTAGDQTNPTVAMDPAGDFVVTWQSNNQDGNGWGVYAQLYSSLGLPVGGEFRVNTTTADNQQDPAVAMDSVGDFVVTWQSHNEDGKGWGIYARQYSAVGLPVGGEFQVNTTNADDQSNPTVAIDALGNFVIAWQSHNQDGNGWGVFAQQYDALGQPVGDEFQVNTYTNSDQINPVATMNSTGAFAIAWQSNNQDGNGWGVYAQRYNADGTTAGGGLRVNTTTTGNQQNPAASLDDSGDLFITWAGPNGSATAIYGQQYTPAGDPLGGEFMVNTTKGYTVTNPSIAMNNQGNVVSVWAGGSAADSAGVFMQQFSISSSQETTDGFYAQGDPNDPDQAHTTPSPAPPVAVVPPGNSGGPMQSFAPNGSGEPSGGAPVQSPGANGSGESGGRPLLRWMAGRHRPHHHQHAPGQSGVGRSPRRDGSHGPTRPGHGLSPSPWTG